MTNFIGVLPGLRKVTVSDCAKLKLLGPVPGYPANVRTTDAELADKFEDLGVPVNHILHLE